MVALWRSPRLGVYFLFAAAVVVEQFEYQVGDRAGAATAQIGFFEGLAPGVGLNPAEALLALVVVFVLLQAARDRRRVLWKSPLGLLLALTLAIVMVYFVLGILRQGDLQMAFWEVRPYFYVAGAYLVARALLTSAADARPLLWILVVGAGAKALYGVVIWNSVRHLDPRPEAVLAHEESFVFGLFIFATVGLWLFGQRSRLRVVATTLLPLVLFADMVNPWRTAWLILFVGVAVLVAAAFVRYPQRRRTIGVALVVGSMFGVVYLAAFWDSSGTLAQPARAVRSEIAPDPRDDQSNEYREIENYNLQLAISNTRSTGAGFGIPVTYIGLVDLTDINPLIRFVPHNGVLYVWWRIGLLGLTVFILFMAQAVMTSARLSRVAVDGRVAFIGAFTAAAVLGYAAMGIVDLGFFWFSNALIMGVLRRRRCFGSSRATRVGSQKRSSGAAAGVWSWAPAPTSRGSRQ